MLTWKEYYQREDLAFPLDTREINGFKRWLSVNEFRGHGSPNLHLGFDLTAYHTEETIEVGLLGERITTASLLPTVFAIESGVVDTASGHDGKSYLGEVILVHEVDSHWLASGYVHIVPDPEMRQGKKVVKGERIGGLYRSKVVAPHLHLTLFEEDDSLERSADYFTPDFFRSLYGDPHWQRARYVDPHDAFPFLGQISRFDAENPNVLIGSGLEELKVNCNRG